MKISDVLIDWYKTNKRDLPWRKTTNPYKIWLSEIMLQQTRVDQGMSYYIKFINKYPKIENLANAQETEILKDWEGLGYYSRARNLHYTAKFISSELKGKFPNTYNEIKKLKGIGPYTAAAIASFSFKERKAVVDGNVYRVLSRIFEIKTPIDSTEGKKEFQNLANELIDERTPDLFNQAIMELGALICLPKSPKCETCPVKSICQSKNNTNWNNFPVKSKKIKIRERFFNYLIIEDEKTILINKRTEKDIWQNLFDFPSVESSSIISVEEINANPFVSENFKKSLNHQFSKGGYKQQLTHQKINASFHHFSIDFNALDQLNITDYLKIKKSELGNYPFPKIIVNYLDSM